MITTVLVSDDGHFHNCLRDMLLEHHDIEIHESSVVEAYGCLQNRGVDLIVVDLPAAGGEKFWKLLTFHQMVPALQRVPVLLCSASPDEVLAKEEWLGDHGIAVIQRPFEIDDLMRRVVELTAGDPRSVSAHGSRLSNIRPFPAMAVSPYGGAGGLRVAPPTQGKLIALVGYDAPLLGAMHEVLGVEGFRTCHFDPRREALTADALQVADVVLVSLDFTSWDGIGFLRDLGHAWRIPCPIIATCAASEDIRRACVSEIFGDILPEPFDLPELLGSLRYAISLHARAVRPHGIELASQ